MNLYILGNGFDLMAGAETTIIKYLGHSKNIDGNNALLEPISNYVKSNISNKRLAEKSKKTKIKGNINQLGFWTTLFMLLKDDENIENSKIQTWKNIELYIFLVTDNVYFDREDDCNELTRHEKQIINTLLDAIFISDQTTVGQKPRLVEQRERKEKLTYLYDQLLIFDVQFAEYLKVISSDSDGATGLSDYAEKVLTNKANIWQQHLNSTNKSSDKNDDIIFNFNYTTANYERIKYNNHGVSINTDDGIRPHEYHVHGTFAQVVRLKPLQGENIESVPLIFGFDQSNLTDNAVYELNRFTKTFQLLELKRKDNTLNNFFSKLTTKNEQGIESTRHIYFIGHSLNESDWSYFFAIFDNLHLAMRSDLTLHFLFSKEYAESNPGAINAYENSIFKLISAYGEQLKLIENGSYLMTKLLLNDNLRVEFISLPTIENEFKN